MLEGKIALVTGASRGIGRQIALTLGREGAAVIVNYNGSAAKAEEVVKEIEAAGGKAEAVQCNVSDFESCGRMMADMVSRYGRLDILVNNAGITRDNLLMKMSEEDFDAVISTNLKGVFNCIKHISRQMLKQKAGRIINTVNAVAPGFIATEMTDVLSDSVKAAATEQIPMKHFGSTQDIAETVAFLASDKAGYITGQVLSVDGGMAM